MGKHNGKARKAGVRPGAVLANKHKVWRTPATVDAARHTTEAAEDTNMQSIIDNNDLTELMSMADLSGREFTAERSNVVVLYSGVADPKDEQRAAEERLVLEQSNAHLLHIPRRPAWDVKMTPEQLGEQERTSFLTWRRALAQLEDVERLVLTPFEKNLEVWRQLWRVLERSDIVIQVVDARDPLLYWSEDLVKYARDINATKRCYMLLNKADLLPEAVRQAWASYLTAAGVPFTFWSAHAAMEAQQKARQQLASSGVLPPPQRAAYTGDPRTRILDADELVDWMEARATEALAQAPANDPRRREDDRRCMVGLVGYPNVGKSSTINALFGSKKTAVAPTPGKTKHFQTLNVSPSVCLCDCPGLVMPRFAHSRAEMVAAGVIPIDRLTDVRAPVQVVVDRCQQPQIEAVYNLQVPMQPGRTTPAAQDVLRALAMARGWTSGSGLPDETRAGRQMLKDYTAGKLVYCTPPPSSQNPAAGEPQRSLNGERTTVAAAADAEAHPPEAASGSPHTSRSHDQHGNGTAQAAEEQVSSSGDGSQYETESEDEEPTSNGNNGRPTQTAQAANGPSTSTAGPPLMATSTAGPPLTEADLDLMASMGLGPKQKPKRAEHKFQRKAPRTKGSRGQALEEGGYDGAALRTGKKGGLVRVAGY